MIVRTIPWLLLLALPAWSQDEPKPAPEPDQPQAEPQPQEEPAQDADMESGGCPYGLELSFAWWIADFSFETRTATEIVEFEDPSIVGVDFSDELRIGDEWAIRGGLEVAAGLDLEVLGLTVGGSYRPDLLPDPFDLSFRAAVIFAKLDMDDVPGDFDVGFGFEVATRLDYSLAPLSDGLAAHVELGARNLKFDFDPDPGVLGGDDSIGGFGARILAGLSYKF